MIEKFQSITSNIPGKCINRTCNIQIILTDYYKYIVSLYQIFLLIIQTQFQKQKEI